jgi:flagellar export protein FliJ
MSGKAMKRLLALRAMEEERAEAELGKQRRLMQACLDALEASAVRRRSALCALHRALDMGDRSEAISAEMVLACGPLEWQILQQRLVHLERNVESATAEWQASRVRRMQVYTLMEAEESRLRREALVKEQKGLDAWFLSSRLDRLRCEDENFPREQQLSTECCGTARAESIQK